MSSHTFWYMWINFLMYTERVFHSFPTSIAPSYPASLCLKWRNKFLLLSFLKIQHPGGWHAAQPATSVRLAQYRLRKAFSSPQVATSLSWMELTSGLFNTALTCWNPLSGHSTHTLYCTLLSCAGHLSSFCLQILKGMCSGSVWIQSGMVIKENPTLIGSRSHWTLK